LRFRGAARYFSALLNRLPKSAFGSVMRIANRQATQNIAKYKAMKVTRPVYGVVFRSTSNPTPIEIDWLTTRLIRKTTSKRMGRPLGVDCALAKS
jgi:hypothetical protein